MRSGQLLPALLGLGCCQGAFPGVFTSTKAQPPSKWGTHLARFLRNHPAERPESTHRTQRHGPTKTEQILHGRNQPTNQTKTQIQLWTTAVTEAFDEITFSMLLSLEIAIESFF